MNSDEFQAVKKTFLACSQGLLRSMSYDQRVQSKSMVLISMDETGFLHVTCESPPDAALGFIKDAAHALLDLAQDVGASEAFKEFDPSNPKELWVERKGAAKK